MSNEDYEWIDGYNLCLTAYDASIDDVLPHWCGNFYVMYLDNALLRFYQKMSPSKSKFLNIYLYLHTQLSF